MFEIDFKDEYPDLYWAMKEKGISLKDDERMMEKKSGKFGNYDFPKDVYNYMYKIMVDEEKAG